MTAVLRLLFRLSERDWFLTSGEVAWRILQAESRQEDGNTTRKCLLVSRDGDTSPLDGLDLTRAESGEDADFILLAASEGDVHPLSFYETLLAPAAARGVPCLCTNPDKIMLTKDGTAFGAGRIAELYAGLMATGSRFRSTPIRWSIASPRPTI
jgi:HAD superfamily hydrolase (TIGR01459 family)